MKYAAVSIVLALVLSGCASIPQPRVEVPLERIEVVDVWDTSSSYIAARLFDDSFNLLGFITGSYYSLHILSMTANEVMELPFITKDEISVFEIKPGRYILDRVVKLEPYWEGQGSKSERRIRALYYFLPMEMTSEFEIKAGEILYIGKIVPRDGWFFQKNYVLFDNDFEKSKDELLNRSDRISRFDVKPLL